MNKKQIIALYKVIEKILETLRDSNKISDDIYFDLLLQLNEINK